MTNLIRCAGHIPCLVYLLQHGCPVSDDTLRIIVGAGHLQIIRLVISRGVSDQPFLYHLDASDGEHCTQGQLACLQQLVAAGRPIHPGTLMWAAGRGDFPVVCSLEAQGVTLWKAACDEEDITSTFRGNVNVVAFWKKYMLRDDVLVVPRMINDNMMKTLMYGWAKGAPVTPAVKAAFIVKRANTRAMLSSFHVAARRSVNEETPLQHKAIFAAMGLMNKDLIWNSRVEDPSKILLYTDLEISETVGRSLPMTSQPSGWMKYPSLTLWT